MSSRRFIFWCHLVSGLVIGSVLLVMAVTGALLAFEPQIVAFAEKSVRQVPPPAQGVTRLNLGTLLAKARENSDGKQPGGLTVYAESEKAVSVQFGKGGGSLFLNPYSGDVLGGESQTYKTMHFIEDLHRRLVLGETGRRVTGVCSIAFFFMILSGIYLWWPKQWKSGALKSILFFKWNISGKARDWNWHNVIGFWCSPLLLLTAVTGMIMSFVWANNLLFKMTGTEPPPPPVRQAAKLGMSSSPAFSASQNLGLGSRVKETPPSPLVNLDASLETIQKQVPLWQSMNLRLPGGPTRGSTPASPIVAAWVTKKGSPSFFRDQLSLDPETGAVLKSEPFSKLPRGRQARTWVKYLHTGEAWGLTGQMLMFISALGAILLIYTGFSLSWRRFFRP